MSVVPIPYDASRWKAFTAAALLLVSAGFGVATIVPDDTSETPTTTTAATTDDGATEDPSAVEAVATETAIEDPSDVDGPVLERFTGDRAEAPSTGTLDLRLDRGPIRVVAWDQPGYEVLVLQENASEDQAVHDHATNVDFQDASSGDTLDLSLVVDRDGTYAVGAESQAGSTEDPHRKRAVIAFVPADTSYGDVLACSGQEWAFEDDWEEAWGTPDWPWGDHRRVDADEGCVATDEEPPVGVHLDVKRDDDDEERSWSFTTGADGLTGTTLTVADSYGDLELADVSFDEVSALAGHGSIAAQSLATSNGTLATEYGDVVVQDAEGADLNAFSGHGDAAVEFTPDDDGRLSLVTEYGDLAAQVATPSPPAYDVLAGTDHGEINVSLQDTTVETTDHDDNRSWQDPETYTGWLEEDGYEKTAEGQTNRYDGAATQTEVRAFTESGDVVVTDTSGDTIDVSGFAEGDDDGYE